MRTFSLTVSSPEGDLFRGEAVCLTVRGLEGELAVLAGHVPFVTPVKACQCKITLEDESVKTANMQSGLLTVGSDRVTLLSGSFEWN